MDEHGMRILIYTVIVSGLFAFTFGSSVTVPPSDQLISLGDDAQFHCVIEGDPKVEAVGWKRQVLRKDKGLKTENIYKTWPEDEPIDKTKYMFKANESNLLDTNLKVKKVDFSDAGRYSCEPLGRTDGAKYANLLVLGRPQITIQPSHLEQGLVIMTCTVEYAGPEGVQKAGLEPIITAESEGKILPGDIYKKLQSGVGKTSLLMFQHKMNRQQQQNFSCRVKIQAAQITYESSTAITHLPDCVINNNTPFPTAIAVLLVLHIVELLLVVCIGTGQVRIFIDKLRKSGAHYLKSGDVDKDEEHEMKDDEKQAMVSPKSRQYAPSSTMITVPDSASITDEDAAMPLAN